MIEEQTLDKLDQRAEDICKHFQALKLEIFALQFFDCVLTMLGQTALMLIRQALRSIPLVADDPKETWRVCSSH